MITYRKASGLYVVSRLEGSIVGKLDDFQFDLTTRRIYGFRIKGAGMWSKTGGVAADLLRFIGRDVAFVDTEADVEWKSGNTRFAEEGRAWASQYRGTRAMSRAGEALGAADDFILDAEASQVLGLQLDSGKAVELDAKVATGPAAVILESADLLQQLPQGDRVKPEGDDWWARLTRRRAEDKPPEPDAEG